MLKPFILVKLDKEYELRISNLALLYFEEITGKNFTELTDSKGNIKFGIKDINALIYGGLKVKNPNMSYEEVINLIDEYMDIETLSSTIERAINESNFFKKANTKKAQSQKKN